MPLRQPRIGSPSILRSAHPLPSARHPLPLRPLLAITDPSAWTSHPSPTPTSPAHRLPPQFSRPHPPQPPSVLIPQQPMGLFRSETGGVTSFNALLLPHPLPPSQLPAPEVSSVNRPYNALPQPPTHPLPPRPLSMQAVRSSSSLATASSWPESTCTAYLCLNSTFYSDETPPAAPDSLHRRPSLRPQSHGARTSAAYQSCWPRISNSSAFQPLPRHGSNPSQSKA